VAAKARARPHGGVLAMRASINSIILGPRWERLDHNKIGRYRRALRRGDKFPSIDVADLGRHRYEVHDGYHRFNAHRLEGRKTIEINVLIGYGDPP
jgi:hypothetical protein